MEVLPATYKSRMHEMIKQKREASTIRFDDLSQLEIRGQCALVRKAVMDKLPKLEADAICARYGHAATKAKGICGIRDHSLSMISTQRDEATLAIACSVFAEKRWRKELSTRKIAKAYTLSQSTVTRDMNAIAEKAKELEDYAIEKLTTIFERSGLIETTRDSTPQ
ncbi:hypothetical protein BGZ97_012363 [Linnemannia gamsii]|uniref:Uncharacterized protein n=1 Tax=Linnemannia gamsii TaxID=64522 RepID=A0A9P6RPM6_9FUNG|nr:hypothetical protein BGZ97_012363 [Linnemannia gamsii]